MTNSSFFGDVQKQKPLSKPSNEIDLQAVTTTPFISSDSLSDRIRNKFRDFAYVLDSEGERVLDENGAPAVQVIKDLWERFYVKYHLDWCLDTLTVMPQGFSKPALISLARATSELESSSSKGGFLRRLFNTFFQHSSIKDDAPTKRSFFGLGKKNKVE